MSRSVFKEVTPTAEDQRRAEAAISPVSHISEADFDRYRGCLVAVLVDGDEKGKIIASARLNFSNPREPREELERQIQASPYRDLRHHVRQILE